MTADWNLVSAKLVHEGHINVVNRSYVTPMGSDREYEVIEHPAVVCVFAVTDDHKVVLVRQFRPGPGRFCTELPAGLVDEDESPSHAAARELKEETGYRGTLREVGKLFTNGYSTEVRHVFVCTDARQDGEPHPDEGEDLEVVNVTISQFHELVRGGEMTVTDAAYLAMDVLGLL
jgi:ADP-ribose pyrophosphatase